MKEQIKISAACIDVAVTELDREQVLTRLTSLLERQGFVHKDYAEKILERERSYPTGLLFPHVAIALPHGDPSAVKESAIAIGRCVNKPLFNAMEDPGQSIGVDLVVLLAVRDPEGHLAVLNNLVDMFTVEENCAAILACTSPEELAAIFRRCLYKINVEVNKNE